MQANRRLIMAGAARRTLESSYTLSVLDDIVCQIDIRGAEGVFSPVRLLQKL